MPSGNVVVRVSTAEGLIPVTDATVFIVDRQSGADNILASRTTGRSGFAQRVTVETPEKALSTSPNEEQAFKRVDIRIEHPLYYPYYITDAQIFADTDSVQNAVLIPLAMPTEKRTETIFITPQNL